MERRREIRMRVKRQGAKEKDEQGNHNNAKDNAKDKDENLGKG